MVIKKTKISTITAVVATIAAIASMGIIGGGIGLGQQQMALAQPVDPRDIGGDEDDLVGVDVGNIVRDVLGDDDDGELQLCPGGIFIPRSAGGPRCADVRDIIATLLPDFP
jgi:hypothetical protein